MERAFAVEAHDSNRRFFHPFGKVPPQVVVIKEISDDQRGDLIEHKVATSYKDFKSRFDL